MELRPIFGPQSITEKVDENWKNNWFLNMNHTIGRWWEVSKTYMFGTCVCCMDLVWCTLHRSMSGASNAHYLKYFRSLLTSLQYLKVEKHTKDAIFSTWILSLSEHHFLKIDKKYSQLSWNHFYVSCDGLSYIKR